MTKREALKILNNSINDLKKRQEKVTVSELREEVINLSLYTILRNRKDKQWETGELTGMINAFSESMKDIVPVTSSFTKAAIVLFPNHYSAQDSVIALENVKNFVFEEDIWETLQKYFRVKHGEELNYVVTKQWKLPIQKAIKYSHNTFIEQNVLELIITVKLLEDEKMIITIPGIVNEQKTNFHPTNDYFNLGCVVPCSQNKYLLCLDKSSFELCSVTSIDEEKSIRTVYE